MNLQGKNQNDVLWEKEKKFNVGFEATLVNKIDVSFDYFIQKRSNILSQPYRPVPYKYSFSWIASAL